jgi:hypothetical protein
MTSVGSRERWVTEDELVEAIRERVSRPDGRFGRPDRRWRDPLPPPANLDEVEETETLLKHPIPSALRRCYLEVANGGFGPGLGILGINSGWTDDRGDTVISIARGRTRYRAKRVFFCYLGGAIYYHFDSTQPAAPVSKWDEGEHLAVLPSMHEFLVRFVTGTIPVV